MGDIRYLPSARENAARVLERAVNEAIARHPDPDVATRWAALASETIARWPGPPSPTLSRLELDPGLDGRGRERLLGLLERWIESYFGDVRDQLMEMHGEMLALQRRVVELEIARERAAGGACARDGTGESGEPDETGERVEKAGKGEKDESPAPDTSRDP